MEDLIFGIGSIVFILAWIPSLFRNEYPAAPTSFITSVILFSFSFAYLSLDMIFAASTSIILALIWWYTFAHTIIANNREESRDKKCNGCNG